MLELVYFAVLPVNCTVYHESSWWHWQKGVILSSKKAK